MMRVESKSRVQPAACGRHVRTGIRQSMPSNNMPSCAGVGVLVQLVEKASAREQTKRRQRFVP
jgi:hypothetical protein